MIVLGDYLKDHKDFIRVTEGDYLLGQGILFRGSLCSCWYFIIETHGHEILLDRPLEDGIVHGAQISFGSVQWPK